MLSLLLSGSKQLGNDINMYLAPLLEDLNKLCNDSIKIFDAYLKEYFILHVIIFYTINDFSALGNLSIHWIKGVKVCPICVEDTHTVRLKNYEKNIYLRYRRFLNRNQPYRRKKKLSMARSNWIEHQCHYLKNKFIPLWRT
jgi:Transposase family tnp2